MANKLDSRLPPLSIRLTFEERAALEQKAAGQSLSSYVKNQVFGASGGSTLGPGLGLNIGASSRRARADTRLLSQILAKLGETNLALSMDELAEAASTGSLYVDHEVEAQLKQACADIAEIRLLLLEALGKRRRPVPPQPKNTTEAFNLSASGRIKPRASEPKP